MSPALRSWVRAHPPWRTAFFAAAAVVGVGAVGVLLGGRTHFGSLLGLVASIGAPALIAALGSWRAAQLVHELEAMRIEAHRLNETDPLTSALSRARFLKTLARDIGVVRRAEGEYSLIVLDVDDLERVAVRYGRPAADSVLVAITELCQGGLRSTDLLARWGDDQLAVALPGTGGDGAREVAERLRDAVSGMMLSAVKGQSIRVTVSVGVSTWGNGADSVDRFTRRADEAMLRARSAGQNRVVLAKREVAA